MIIYNQDHWDLLLIMVNYREYSTRSCKICGNLNIFFKMLVINNRTLIIYNQNFKYLPEPIIYNGKLYTMKPQGSSINKPGSKYSPAPVIYNWALFIMGATDQLVLPLRCC
jgi:hypothetical protein